MPRGDEAILKDITARWDAGALARWWRSLLPADPATGVVARVRVSAAAMPVAMKIALPAAVAVLILLIAGFAMRRDGAVTPESASAPVSPRRNGKVAVRTPQPVPAQPANGIRSFSTDYKVLLTRSMFAVGGRPAALGSSLPLPVSIPTAPAITNFSLKGISQEDNRFTAYVEDGAAKRIVQIHVGDALGSARVCDMTLYSLGFELNGHVTRVEIGHGLDGSTLAVAAPPDGAQVSRSGHKKRPSNGEAHASAVGDGH